MDFDRGEPASSDQPTEENDFFVQAPSISLPKGGGAVRGIGEKFAANPVTGTGSLSVPIATSPGRNGFGPQLSLSYDSGAGNGVFGLGWNLSLPNISRKTDKGLPQYIDSNESDVFLLSGAEDLVPELEQKVAEPRTVNSRAYKITRYRPRIEGLFARIEKWTNTADAADVFWRSISKENITTWYGKTAESRVTDPNDSRRIFKWLICESYDDKGNVISYEYKAEDSTNVDLFQVHERNRTDIDRTANRYLKRIKYGNRYPYFATLTAADPPTPLPSEWFFEVVFDYGEHTATSPLPEDTGAWKTRKDPFSRYRAGFEVRTYRLCERVLMFHHFDGADIQDQPGVGKNYLVKSTNFTYQFNDDDSAGDIPKYTVLQAVTHTGHRKKVNGEYANRSIPPVEFTYSPAEVGKEVKNVASDSIENLPAGVDGSRYQWVDLDGEGLTGVLTEQGGGWFYKYNKSPLTRQRSEQETQYSAQLGATQRIRSVPTGGLSGVGGRRFMDLAGNGRPDLVEMARPVAGFYQRSAELDWEPFRSFEGMPNIDWQDPNLKFIDLTGDGHADIVVSEGDVFTWYESRAEKGFGEAKRSAVGEDEEQGPRIVFADGTDTIVQADLSGDGLTDIARIRNGEICYWPNLGYGHFGKKITMGGAPWFAPPDQFDPSRLRLTDVDGSGVTDVIYLGNNATTIWFNQSGNSWSEPQIIDGFPTTDSIASVAVVDLLGNGTACLVWSSTAPADNHASLRYIELMAKGKPHLLVTTNNNMGAETEIQYAPSTYFYLKDQHAGKPWATRLPFPVHVVAKVVVTDKWRKSRFATQYSYHHGYFDGVEREFRGFGRVEQTDIETFGEFAAGNAASPYITDDLTLYQPPVKTISWFHTGAALERDKILDQFETEYFPNGQNVAFDSDFQENDLPPVDLSTLDLSTEEWREAIRACKGMPLRQEVYELAVDPLDADDSSHVPVKLFSTAYHNCNIQRLQAKGVNEHAVFLVTESEAVTYNYELDLTEESLTPDPRISHTLNLKIDEYGNVLQGVTAVYPRIGSHEDSYLDDSRLRIIDNVQKETRIAYLESRFTNDVDGGELLDSHRLPLPCEVKTYELTGNNLKPSANFYFALEDLRALRLVERRQNDDGTDFAIPYHQKPNRTEPEKRIVEHVRMLYFDDDLVDALPFGNHNALALPFETYKLALTDELLNGILGNKLSPTISAELEDAEKSGYLSGSQLAVRFDGIETAGQYWIRSGIAGYAEDAADHFFLSELYTDAFDQTTILTYDLRDLYIESSIDPADNTVSIERFDYRVLAPSEQKDINDNLSEVIFDVLGLPAAVAVKGEGGEADNLDDLTDTDELLNPDIANRIRFFAEQRTATETIEQYQLRQQAEARRLLGNATARHLYYFGETEETLADGSILIHWGEHPVSVCGIVREQHVAQLDTDETSPLQMAFEYSDGGGNVLVTKAQAEPESDAGPLRWIANGKTVLNNKGKPVKQYEPYFSTNELGEPDHRFEEPREHGVTSILYYDAAGRVIRTESPDGSYSRVSFSPWHVISYDSNDTVLELDNAWYQRMIAGTAAEQRAALVASKHADTPATTFLDSLGREVLSIALNRIPEESVALGNTPLLSRPWLDEKYLTFTRLDAEGKPLWIKDARDNLVMRYTVPASPAADPTISFYPAYDVAGNLLFQHSMDGGDRWLLADATGQPFYVWDENENAAGVLEQRVFHTTYDDLRRPLKQGLNIAGEEWTVERFVYGEEQANDKARNLRGQVYQHYDSSGLISNEDFDLKGNLLNVKRRLASAIKESVIHWPDSPLSNAFVEETFSQSTKYDALNRMVLLQNWHLEDREPAIYTPQYNQRGVLLSEELTVRSRSTQAIQKIEYDAKGQRTSIEYGNNTRTSYKYDTKTFRLIKLETVNTITSEKLQDLNYTYDAVGNITEITDGAIEPVFFRNQEVKASSKYLYDALYRLIEAEGREQYSASGPPPQRLPPAPDISFPVSTADDPNALRDYTQRYQYDGVGNITQMRHAADRGSWTRDYAYAEDSNRLLSTWTGGNRTTAVNYQYDTHGNMLNLNNVPEDFRMRWDTRDMIHHVDLQGGGNAWYNYDSAKQRTRKRIERIGGFTEERFYLGGMELYRRRNAASEIEEEIETFQLFADDQRILIVEDVFVADSVGFPRGVLFRYQYGNHLGSVALEINENTTPITYEEFHPYGTTACQARNKDIKAAKKRYRYTGMERDEEIGLSYHTARYYLPWLGRWGSVDPIGVKGGTNFYIYSDNPLIFYDSTGLIVESSTIQIEDHHTQGQNRHHEIRGVDQAQIVGSRIRASVSHSNDRGSNEQGYFETRGTQQVLTVEGEEQWSQYQVWRQNNCTAGSGCAGEYRNLTPQAIMWMSMIKDDVNTYDLHPIDLQSLPRWAKRRLSGVRMTSDRPFTITGSNGLNVTPQLGQRRGNSYAQGETLSSTEVSSAAHRQPIPSSGQSNRSQVFYLHNDRGLEPSVVVQAHEAFHAWQAVSKFQEGDDPAFAAHELINRDLYIFLNRVIVNAFRNGTLDGDEGILRFYNSPFDYDNPAFGPPPRRNWCGSDGRCAYPR